MSETFTPNEARIALGTTPVHNIGSWEGRSPLPQWLNDLTARGLMRLVAIDKGNALTEPRRWKAHPTGRGIAVRDALEPKP